MADGTAEDPFGIDRFPVACFATDRLRVVRFANAGAARQFGRTRTEMVGLGLDRLLTPASLLFCDSYVYPMLLIEGRCEEIALTVRTGADPAPAVMNACVHDADPDVVLWSSMLADRRDKLQNELLASRNQLQRQTRTLGRLAARDELTGLMNRRKARIMIDQLVSAADRVGAAVTVLLVDVDRFKAINDRFGHDAGDAVLRQLGAAFAATVRLHEIAGRYGGEEFVFAIASSDMAAVKPFCRRLHAAAASVTGPGAPLTVSIGLASREPRSDRSLDALVTAADRALYEAKARGRDRSIIATEHAFAPVD